eukprot:133880-Amphidinium_carterae.1
MGLDTQSHLNQHANGWEIGPPCVGVLYSLGTRPPTQWVRVGKTTTQGKGPEPTSDAKIPSHGSP